MEWSMSETRRQESRKVEESHESSDLYNEKKYQSWIYEQLEWLQDYTSNENMVLVKMISNGILMPNEREAILAKCTSLDKWQEIYLKILRLGLSKIDVVISILETTTNGHVADKFKEFKGSLEVNSAASNR